MSTKVPKGARPEAAVFAALGDETRLSLLAQLSGGQRHSISELTQGTSLTRQAVTKHLQILQRVQIVQATRSGRESLFELDPKPLIEMRAYLETVSSQWDAALTRLKTFVEDNPD